MSSAVNSPKTTNVTLVIENFPQLKSVQQTSFSIDNKKIFFGLCPKIDIPAIQNENIFVYWWHYEFDRIIGNVQFKVSIVNANGDKLYTIEHNWKFGKSPDYPITKFILRENLLNPKNCYLVNDRLILFCEVELMADKTVTNSISEDYESLLNSGDYSDATLVIGQNEFRVHKAILAARSPVFNVMFKHEQTCEARSNQVDIIDVSVDVFQQLIRYIYSGKVEGLDRFALELMVAADKYQVNTLKDICEQFLCSNLSTESVGKVLVLADFHRAAQLRSKCIDYITKQVRKVKATDGWKLLESKPELLVELLLCLSDKHNAL